MASLRASSARALRLLSGVDAPAAMHRGVRDGAAAAPRGAVGSGVAQLEARGAYVPLLHYRPLAGRTMAMIFQKRSTRTRVSTEAGFVQLGGHAIFLSPSDVQLGVNESMKDTAKVLSRYADVILARVFGHADVEELAAEASVPVINALSDAQHPLQLLADIQTLQEHFRTCGRPDIRGIKVAWVGDGNNILHGFLEAAGPLGLHVRAATPKGYDPDARLLARARESVRTHGAGSIELTHDPVDAVHGADVIVTDTWVSMGMEKEKEERLRAFKGYQVTEELARKGGASPDWVFLHCLPRKPEEVDDAVFYSKRSLVWDEAENRKWTVMAVALAQILGKVDVPVPALR